MSRKIKFSAICILLITTMLCSFVILPVSAATEAEANALAKIDSALLEKMETASPDEKIPVAIWYTDIDQDNVDKLTVEKVGFTQDDIALTYEMPSTKLITDLENGEADAVDEIQTYLQQTKAIRALERKKSNEYIMTRREFARSKYSEKSANIIKNSAINENDIIFKSQYSPMIIVHLTRTQIEQLQSLEFVESIRYYVEDEVVCESIETALEVTKVKDLIDKTELGLSGEGVKVGIIENHSVLISTQEQEGLYIVPDVYPPSTRTLSEGTKMTDYGNVVVVGNTNCSDEDSHPNKVADSLLSVAPNITLYSSAYSFKNIEAMITDGVQLMSMSLGIGVLETSSEYGYTTTERWFDHLIAQHKITLLKSGGNNGEHESDYKYMEEDDDGNLVEKQAYGPRNTSPGMAYNVITVGAFKDDITPNQLYSYSSYQNSITTPEGTTINGCAKPDVIAPASFNDGGTSNATPFLAGMIALMYELKPSLAAFPQAVKAIVLASCHDKVTQVSGSGAQESIYDGITDRQGAGAPNAWTMMAIVCQGTYGVGIIDSYVSQKTIRFTQPSYDALNMNISLTWLKNNSYNSNNASHTSSGLVNEGENVNLNMNVYRNGTLLESSTLPNSSTEMTYFELSSIYSDYEVRISKALSSNEDVRYGYAYSTDEMLMTRDTNEGVYRLRNLESNTYLTLDNSSKELNLGSYSNSTLQQWIIKQSSAYQISSAYGTTTGIINRSSTAIDSTNNKAVLGNNTLNLSLSNWYNRSTDSNKGGVVLYSYMGGTQIYLDYYNSYATFSSVLPNSSESKIWVLEKVNYIRGDANVDGKYNIRDATLVQKYLSHEETLNNLQMFLADANYDGSVTIKDSTKIQKDLLPNT